MKDTQNQPCWKKLVPTNSDASPKSSTTHALISMIHTWTKHTDGNGANVRVVLFDYRKAFDLIGHSILASKLRTLDLPHVIICWIIDFLKCRKQRVRLERDCQSEWIDFPAGVPQGTKLGPWLFVLMIGDIGVTKTDLWKYVDDTTITEPIHKNGIRNIQNAVSELNTKSLQNKFQLNETKCKELRISFAKGSPNLTPLVVNEKPIDVVSNVKLLGLNISDNLKWNFHVGNHSKGVQPSYFLKQLKRANVLTKELLTFSVTCIRPITEHAR